MEAAPHDGGRVAQTLAGDASRALAGLRRAAAGTSGHGHFCGLFPARAAAETSEKIEMDPLDSGRRSPARVFGTSRFRNLGNESAGDIFETDGGAHAGHDDRASAKSSGLDAVSG